MKRQGPWGRVLWGSSTLATGALVLAIASASSSDQRWVWIVPSAVFIFIHTIVRAVSDRSITKRLGDDYDRVQHRALRVITDLAGIAGEKYDLWMIDLYVPIRRWVRRSKFPWILRHEVLSLELSISLLDSRPQPPEVEVSDTAHGRCFADATRLLWVSNTVDDGTPPPAGVECVGPDVSAGLEGSYGVLLLAPIVDQLGKGCSGVLAVHVGPDRDIALQASGVLRSAEGLSRIRDACVELNGFLRN